jgi:hypothetical protein
MKAWWLSSNRMTVVVMTVEYSGGHEIITEAAPIVNKFVGQPLGNLERWMRKQGGFEKYRLALGENNGP